MKQNSSASWWCINIWSLLTNKFNWLKNKKLHWLVFSSMLGHPDKEIPKSWFCLSGCSVFSGGNVSSLTQVTSSDVQMNRTNFLGCTDYCFISLQSLSVQCGLNVSLESASFSFFTSNNSPLSLYFKTYRILFKTPRVSTSHLA